jgi:hypothetical protein
VLACADRAENDGDVDDAGPELRGKRIEMVPITADQVPDLRRILHTPEVRLRWGDEAASPYWPFDDPSATRFAIVLDGAVIGMVQYGEEEEPAYRHASIDIFLIPSCTGGRSAATLWARWLATWCTIGATTAW